MNYKLKYLKYKKKYLDLVKLMVGSGHNLSQEEINKRQNEELDIIMKAIYDTIGDSFFATNMDEFLGQWIIPNNLTAEEFQKTLAAFPNDKTRKEYILDLTSDRISDKLFDNVGEAASDMISRFTSILPNDISTGNNLQDYIIESLPFLNPYIDDNIISPSNESPVTSPSDELPVTFRVYSDDTDIGDDNINLRQGAYTGDDDLSFCADQTEEYEKKQQNNLPTG